MKPSVRSFPLVVVGLALAFYLGMEVGGSDSQPGSSAGGAAGASAGGAPEAASDWTCSMHPQIRTKEPGKCPLCFMDLVLASAISGGADAVPAAVVLSARDHALAEIEVDVVRRREVEVDVRLVGKIAYDESRLSHVSAWVGGRIDRLYLDVTGTYVEKGDHLAELYSPDLRQAQDEYLIAWNRWSAAGEGARESFRLNLEAIRKKFELWGISAEQLRELEARGTATDRMTLTATSTGWVVEKEAFEGKYVMVGERLFTIANLARVWVKLDVYEADLVWVHYGQPVTIEVEAYPGREFTGVVALVEPFLDERTRTVKVRANLDNLERRLRPGMFVRARIRARATSDGRAFEPNLAGRYICPMHPEMLSEEPVACSACGMPLVSTERYGYSQTLDTEAFPLIIPASAPLITGERALVFVEEALADGGRAYSAREVLLGPRAGAHQIVLAGLAEGERVVSRGAFKIDGAVQIQGRMSMMSRTPLPRIVVESYLELAAALAEEDVNRAGEAADALRTALVEKAVALTPFLEGQLPRPGGLEDMRQAFGRLSSEVVWIANLAGHRGEQPLAIAHCPMAFGGKGALWLQPQGDLANPYLGPSHASCGTVRRVLRPSDAPLEEEPSSANEPLSDDPLPLDVVRAYLAIQTALAADDASAAAAAAAALRTALDAAGGELDEALRAHAALGGDLASQRIAFLGLSNRVLAIARHAGYDHEQPLVETHCSMAASGRGASWLQEGRVIANPYWGSQMLRCGDVVAELARRPGAPR